MGITERREREKEQRHNDIIDAAEKVFFSRGLEHATMDNVAVEAELSKGTLYLYFKSKEELYLAIHLRGNRILKNMFETAVGRYKTGIEKVRAVGQAYLEFYKKYPDYFFAMIYYESRNFDYQDTESIAVQCMELGASTLEILIEAIEFGKQDGTIRSDIDAKKTAVSLWGQSTGIIQITALKEIILIRNHEIKSEEVIEYTFDLIYHALKA
jgi:TetR/AcrR family transcriptional regulator